MFYRDKDADVSAFYSAADLAALDNRPNFYKSTDDKHCKAFAVFKPLAMIPKNLPK